MSVLNPFFRQQVQDPGMDVSVGSRPPANTAKIQDEMMNEEREAFNSMMELGVVWAKAEAQIQNEENQLTLKKTANDIAKDASIMLDGYNKNKDFKVGNIEVKTGEKGFHTYTGFDKTKESIESDMISRLQNKYNPEGNEKLNELIELQVTGSFIDPFNQSDNIIRKYISDMSLAEIEEKGIEYLNNIRKGDYSSVLAIDSLIDEKALNGNISNNDAIKAKISFRKRAWNQIVRDMNPINATAKEKRLYLDLFNNSMESITNPPTVYDSAQGKNMPTAESEFFKYLTKSDLQDINRTHGVSAYVPDKNKQKFELLENANASPQDFILKYGGRIEYTRNPTTGKPTGIKIVPAHQLPTTAKMGKLGGNQFLKDHNIVSKEVLYELNKDNQETLQALKGHFESKKPIGPIDIIVRKQNDQKWYSYIEKKLLESNFDLIGPLDVIKAMDGERKELLKTAKENWSPGTYKELTTEFTKDINVWLADWNALYTTNPITGFYERTSKSLDPEKPYLNDNSAVLAKSPQGSNAWNSSEKNVQDVRNSIEQIHSQLKLADDLLFRINNAEVVTREQIQEAETEINDIIWQMNHVVDVNNEVNNYQRQRALSLIEVALKNRWSAYKAEMSNKDKKVTTCEKMVVRILEKPLIDAESNRVNIDVETASIKCAQGLKFR